MAIQKNLKAILVPFAQMVIDQEFNVREADAYMDIENLVEHLKMDGQKEAGIGSEQPDGSVLVLVGNLRGAALKYMADNGIAFSDTAIMAGDQRGKVPTGMRMVVHKGLTRNEEITLMADHGTQRGLNRVETFYSFERIYGMGVSEKELFLRLRNLFDKNWPLKTAVEGKPGTEEYLANLHKARRGILLPMIDVANSPMLLRDAFVQRLKGNQTWPTNAEIKDFKQDHAKDLKANPLKVNRNNPGPEFMKRWNDLLKKEAEAKKLGKKRVKATAMLSVDQIKQLFGATNSQVAKLVLLYVQNTLPPERWTLIDKAACLVELHGVNDEALALFDEIMHVDAPAAEQPAAEQPAEQPAGEPAGELQNA